MKAALANAIQLAARNPVPYFQPIIFADGSLAYEALGRLVVGSSVLTPGDFLGALGTETFLHQFDEAMAAKAIEQMLHWNQSRSRPVGMHINVSQETLANGIAYAYLIGCLVQRWSEHERRLVTIEVTEAGCFWKNQTILNQLSHLRRIGVNVVVDDFPNWEAPADLLAWLGFNYEYGFADIKIDRSLVRKVCDGDEGATRELDSYVQKANENGLEVIAEGIESFGDAEYMIQAGVFGLQGYGIGRPQPKSRAYHLVDAGDESGTFRRQRQQPSCWQQHFR